MWVHKIIIFTTRNLGRYMTQISSSCGGLVAFGHRLAGVNFFYVEKIENFWKCFAKISVTKFQKLKIGDDHLVRFSMLFVVVYFVFSVKAFFMEKIVKQNRLFWQGIRCFKIGQIGHTEIKIWSIKWVTTYHRWVRKL